MLSNKMYTRFNQVMGRTCRQLAHASISLNLVFFTFFLAASLFSHAVYAIDLQPGDIVAPPPDLNIVQSTYQVSKRGDFYQNNQKSATPTQLSNSQLQLRYTNTFETGTLPSVFYVQTPMGYTHPEKALSAIYKPEAGVGDTTLVYAFWPYVNREEKKYWALGAYLTLPTGHYDAANGVVNMGGNRSTYALQSGYQMPFGKDVNWMTAIDAVWFGDNQEFSANKLAPTKLTLTQSALYTLQTGLSYDINPKLTASAAYFYTVGGETARNGKAWEDETQLQRYQLSLSSKFSFGRLVLQYGADLTTKNGFIEDSRLIVRYIKAF